MSEGGSIPEEYCDEWSAPGRQAPTDWIEWRGEAPFLASNDYLPGQLYGAALTDGEIVKFLHLETHGEIDLTLAADGFSFAAPPPAEFGQCYAGSNDILADNVDELIQQLRDDKTAPGVIAVKFYTWSGPAPFRFDKAARAFEAVSA